jgi:hypothetical protein
MCTCVRIYQEWEVRDPHSRDTAGNLEVSIARGIAALETLQHSDGSFPLERRSASGTWVDEHRLFATATVLWCVGDLLSPRSRDSALSYMLSHRLESGLSSFDCHSGLPADADDSASVLACLALWRPGRWGVPLCGLVHEINTHAL